MSPRRTAAVLALGAASVTGFLLLGGSDEPPDGVTTSARAASPIGADEGWSPLVADLPVARLTWRCDDAGRYSVRLKSEGGLDLSVVSDGRRVLSRSQRGDERVSTPFAHVRRQVWRIRWRHKPGTVRATVRIRFGHPRSCYVARASTDVTTSPNDVTTSSN